MKTLFITFKLLWRRKYANISLILQILFSVLSLSQLFVFVWDHIDSMRAVNELPIEHTITLSAFEYCPVQEAETIISSSPFVEAVGRTHLSSTCLNGINCNLAVYNDAITEHYSPALHKGSWFSTNAKSNDHVIEAIVSCDTGLHLKDVIDISMPDNEKLQIEVVGILKEPTQYFFPSGFASPNNFSAKMVISHDPVVMLKENDILNLTGFDDPVCLFIFLRPETTEGEQEMLVNMWNIYGEITEMPSLIRTYNRNTQTMIGLGTITFIVFAMAAATGVLGNNIIQSMRNRKLFTVYYLLGMDWKRSILLEITRVVVLLVITMMLCVIMGGLGLLMLEWMNSMRMMLFYGFVFLYVLVMFIAVDIGFLVKLIREDISTSLKELHQGE